MLKVVVFRRCEVNRRGRKIKRKEENKERKERPS